MKHTSKRPDWLPETVILLGTDASGKNHVAQVWVQQLQTLGCSWEIREGRLSSKPVSDAASDSKSFFSLQAEQWFLRLFPLLKPLLPLALTWIMRWDAARFRPGTKPLLLISHNALRILALCLGQGTSNKIKPIGASLIRAIKGLQSSSQALVIVLDIDHHIRTSRIQKRLQQDDVDPFDRYMAADSERSERIEDSLVQLAMTHFGAALIENNDLSNEELWLAFKHACLTHQAQQNG